jgi:hypothetical protein
MMMRTLPPKTDIHPYDAFSTHVGRRNREAEYWYGDQDIVPIDRFIRDLPVTQDVAPEEIPSIRQHRYLFQSQRKARSHFGSMTSLDAKYPHWSTRFGRRESTLNRLAAFKKNSRAYLVQ